MKRIEFNLPTSFKDIRQLYKERNDARYIHNKRVLRTVYKDIINNLKSSQRGFKETNELRDCLIRGLKELE